MGFQCPIGTQNLLGALWRFQQMLNYIPISDCLECGCIVAKLAAIEHTQKLKYSWLYQVIMLSVFEIYAYRPEKVHNNSIGSVCSLFV